MTTYRATRGAPFSADERRELVDTVVAAYQRQWRARIDRDFDEDRAATAVIVEVGDRYRAAVPYVPLTRCPFTTEIVSHSIDPFDIDGLWWAYKYNFRPEETLPATFFAVSGAMKLDGPVPDSPYLVMPGPEKPFVLPRILEYTEMRAVVSSVLVGEHIGFPVFYFASEVPLTLDRTDDWGRSFTRFHGPHGELREESYTPRPIYNSYDLGYWIAKGKLAWIAPGDASMTLHWEVSGCPYLNLPGDERPQYIQDGKIRLWEE